MFQVKVWMEIMDDTAMIPSLLFFHIPASRHNLFSIEENCG